MVICIYKLDSIQGTAICHAADRMDSGNRITVLNISQFRQEWFRGWQGSSMIAACKRGEIPRATEERRQHPESVSAAVYEWAPESMNQGEEWRDQDKLMSNFVGKQTGVWCWDTPDHHLSVSWSGCLKTNDHLGLPSIWEISSDFAFLKGLGGNPLQTTSCQMCQDTSKHIKILLLCDTTCMRNALCHGAWLAKAQTENRPGRGTLSRQEGWWSRHTLLLLPLPSSSFRFYQRHSVWK